MSNKTHLGRQDEAFEEQGFIIRTDDPTSPVENMTWFNTTEQRFKIFRGGSTRIIAESLFTTEIEVPVDGSLDGSVYNNFYKNTVDDLTLSFDNFFDGLEVKLLVRNTGVNTPQVTNFTLPSADLMNDGNYFTLTNAKDQDDFHVYYDFNGSGLNTPVVPGSTPIQVIVTPGRFETTDLTFPDAATLTTGQHFLLWAGNDTQEYYIWFNKDGGGGDPLIPGKIGIQIPVTTGDTAIDVAGAVASSVTLLSDFTATNSGTATATIEATALGNTTNTQNVDVASLVLNTTIEGAPIDSATDVAIATAAAINAVADFSAPVPGSPTITVTNADPGSASDPVNVDIPTGFSFTIVTPGEGLVILTLPSNAKSDFGDGQASIPASTARLFSIVKMQNFFYMRHQDFSL